MKKLITYSALLLLFPLCAEYGAGELQQKGRVWYVAVDGNDKNDGRTPQTAWKSIEHGFKFLKAGDTLQIGEGTHKTGRAKINQTGKKRFIPDTASLWTDGRSGAPICIRGADNGKTVLTGAITYPCSNGEVGKRTAEFQLTDPPLYDTVWEYPSGIMLQRVSDIRIAREYPGTFYLAPGNKMFVHFAALDQQGVHVSHDRVGLAVRGSYVLIENLTFRNYREAVFAQQNMAIKRTVTNLTVRNCTFTGNYKTAVQLRYMKNALVTGCRFRNNGDYGSIRVGEGCSDNMITGNWVGASPQTRRDEKSYAHNYAVQKYGGKKEERNHYIGNVIDDYFAFRWKPFADKHSRFEDNIVTGVFYAESLPSTVFIRNNFFGGAIDWQGIGRNIWEEAFAGTPITFRNNTRRRSSFKSQNKMLKQAQALTMTPEKIRLPEVTFERVQVKHADNTGAVIEFFTPENDGWGSIRIREKKLRKIIQIKSSRQGVHHLLCAEGLKAGTEYEYQPCFAGRRGESVRGKWNSFKIASQSAQPRRIPVDPQKMSLTEAGAVAAPGDTLILLPGKHYGQFIPLRSGLPGKPITLTAQKGAVIDGMRFYSPLIDLSGRKHWVIDGVAFSNPAPTGRRGMIAADRAADLTIRNCRNLEENPYTAGPFVSGYGERFVIRKNISWGGSYPVMIRGNGHVIQNNTIVNATFYSIFVPNVKNITITDNIFYRPCVKEKTNPAILFQNSSGKVVCDRNVYYSPYKHHPGGGRIRNKNEKIILQAKDFADWQKRSGWDQNSICADPQFVNVKTGDFRLKENSPAKGKGALGK